MPGGCKVKSREQILLRLFFMPADPCRLCLEDAGSILTYAAGFLVSVLPESTPQ